MKASAQAEVKASSGPIELSLLLHKTEIKLGEELWHQLRIRNVGDKEIVVADRVFQNPWQLRRNFWAGYGVFIEVLAPDGKPLKTAFKPDSGNHIQDNVSGLLEMETPEDKALVEGWKARGLSEDEIKRKLIDHNIKKQDRAIDDSYTPVRLNPGAAIETKSWFHYSDSERLDKRPEPRPIGDFRELHFFDLDRPGEYKIRAVYNMIIPAELRRSMGNKIKTLPVNVLVRTPWVRVSVSK